MKCRSIPTTAGNGRGKLNFSYSCCVVIVTT
jgi:hypothetical protein